MQRCWSQTIGRMGLITFMKYNTVTRDWHSSTQVAVRHWLQVAQFRGVTLGQILYGGDDLSCVEWDERSWQLRAAIREKLFWLCADAVLTV